MPRVPLAEFEPALSKKLEELWGTPPNLYRALGNQPRLVAAWAEFSRVLRHEARTPRALRELVILRGAQVTRSEYEWAQHLPMARKAGVREAQIAALARWRSSKDFGAGVLFFPISYVFGDVLTEVYGYARARRVIWAGFAGLAFAALMAAIVVALPPAPFWKHQDAYEIAFGTTWRIAAASMIAYFCGEV